MQQVLVDCTLLQVVQAAHTWAPRMERRASFSSFFLARFSCCLVMNMAGGFSGGRCRACWGPSRWLPTI